MKQTASAIVRKGILGLIVVSVILWIGYYVFTYKAYAGFEGQHAYSGHDVINDTYTTVLLYKNYMVVLDKNNENDQSYKQIFLYEVSGEQKKQIFGQLYMGSGKQMTGMQ
jgi:hypothetical protein